MVMDKEKELTAFVEILISRTLLPPTRIPLPKTLVLPPPVKEKKTCSQPRSEPPLDSRPRLLKFEIKFHPVRCETVVCEHGGGWQGMGR